MASRSNVAEASGRPPIRTKAVVTALVDEGGPNRRLRLAVEGWPGFDAGQFVMLSAGALTGASRTDPLLPRPMAVYREAGADSEIEILFKRHGRGTTLLAEVAPGDRVRLVGPLGRGFTLPGTGERAVIVAGGTGIASVYELAARCRLQGQAPRVLLGARSAGDLMGEGDFAGLGVDVEIATEDGSRGHAGLVTELLETVLGEEPRARVYACGPTPMMRRAAQVAAAAGRPCVASLENPMACGFGVCLGCAAPLADGGIALVCRDGPVFDAASIAWESLP
jgi:dihydroorotate dehydrogenase electron transfer subunit